jgi:predicted outer membrane protein
MTRRASYLLAFVPCLAIACGNGDDSSAAGGHDASLGETSVLDGAAVGATDARPDGLAPDGGALTDGQIAGIVMAANTGEIDEAEMALGAGDAGAFADSGIDAGPARTTNPAVVAFAEMMVNDHSMSNAAVAALGITAEASAVQQNLQNTVQTTIASQLAPVSGAAFDVAYMKAQVAAHTAVEMIVQTQLVPQASSAQLKNFLQTVLLPTVETHLSDATSLLATLQDGGAPETTDASDASDGARDATAE